MQTSRDIREIPAAQELRLLTRPDAMPGKHNSSSIPGGIFGEVPVQANPVKASDPNKSSISEATLHL